MKLETLVIGTHNPAKLDYYQNLLTPLSKKIVGLKDIGIDQKPTETGDTAEENSQIKAKFYSQRTNLPVFCEDESLFVDFLPPSEQPGVNVRRINHNLDATDSELFDYWENVIKNVPEAKRTGYWRIAYTLMLNNKLNTVSFDRLIKFFYPASDTKISGWPLNSLQGPAKFNKPFIEMTSDEKNLIQKEENQLIIKKLISLFK